MEKENIKKINKNSLTNEKIIKTLNKTSISSKKKIKIAFEILKNEQFILLNKHRYYNFII